METKLVVSATFTAEAATGNPNLGWLDFILTDDKPNNKKQGLKADTFDRLISSGLLMPVKVARGGIELDHRNAEPLGAIAFLDKKDDVVIGKAAIWKEERPSDYQMLREMASQGENIDISWELAYTDASTDDDGVEWILDPILTAATIVGYPAYGGRTPVTSVASGDVDGDDTQADKELFNKLEGKVVALETELTELRGYKEDREKEDASEEMLGMRVGELKSAGFDYTPEEIGVNKELWLELSDASFKTMVDMMGSVKEHSGPIQVPDISGDGGNGGSVVDIVREGFRKMKDSQES